ncbi:MAG: glucokinase [Thermoanaerobaculales bacterium]
MLVLAGDIGGTKSLLAAARGDRDRFEIVAERRFASPAYPDLAPIILEFTDELPEPIGAACFGVPGAVVGGECRTPNLPWFLTEAALERDTGIARVLLINDFAAAALGVLALPHESLLELQGGTPVEHGTKAVIGAGTGLGQAILFWDGHDYRVNPTEAGHGGFAAQGELQHALALSLEPGHLPVSVERIVSGPGLVRIYDFLVARGAQTVPHPADSGGAEDPAARIARCAAAGTDPAAEQALDLFVDAYGAEAGSLALRVLATGGVYVAGGIAPKILAKLQDGTFMRGFARKGRMREFMARFPVNVVLEPRVGLLGALTQAARLLA